MSYSFVIVVNGVAQFTYSNLSDSPILPLVGERIRCVNTTTGVTWDYTVDSKVVTTQLSGGVCYNSIQVNAHITIL